LYPDDSLSCLPLGSALIRINPAHIRVFDPFIFLNASEVYKFAVRAEVM
jgi:hypothetical protein